MADKFDQFDDHARRVLPLAQEEARRFNHNYIGTEHILLGLIREHDGVAARVLSNMGVQLPKVRSAVEFIIGRGDLAPIGDIRLTPRAKKVIELAVDEARRLNHHYIGTEHLLLGLVREGEGIAAGVLDSMGASLKKVRIETLVAIGAMERPPASDLERLTSAPDGVTEEARAVLDRAREETKRRENGYIDTEHILLAITEEECIARQVLTGLDVDLQNLWNVMVFLLDQRRKGEVGAHGLSLRAKHVIDLADVEARYSPNKALNSGHLLLGIMRVRSGLASGMLEILGLDLEPTRAEVNRVSG